MGDLPWLRWWVVSVGGVFGCVTNILITNFTVASYSPRSFAKTGNGVPRTSSCASGFGIAMSRAAGCTGFRFASTPKISPV